MSSLSPWDLSGLGMGFGLYRPRRPSYTYATQSGRQRSESYRYAVRKSTSDEETPDFIEGIIQRKNRKESYVRATRNEEPLEMEIRIEGPRGAHSHHRSHVNNHTGNSITCTSLDEEAECETPTSVPNLENHLEELKAAVAKKRSPRRSPYHSKSPSSNNHSPRPQPAMKNASMDLVFKDEDEEGDPGHGDGPTLPSDYGEVATPCSEDGSAVPTRPFHIFKFKKNLVLLCLSFILVFSAFRAIQNLQSSLNTTDNLGIIAMTCVHGAMCVACILAPMIINSFTAKWTLVCGTFSFLLWIAANFYPRFYTLIPVGICAGLGQGILWTAESSYILKLAFDFSRISRDGLEREVFRFHGIFLACFQTTHIWGNLISSLILHSAKAASEAAEDTTFYNYSDLIPALEPSCGVLFPCVPSSMYGKFSTNI